MTSGERMVWAAEFVRCQAAGGFAAQLETSVRCAAVAVAAMRSAVAAHERGKERGGICLTPSERVMLDDMLGTGADR